ncbi:hypothetical protein [uncultured Abyssibacter sp.]|uniref:hypothetical protein n=1 Tax=uncultured Abyssibacter sp. TaxID=2320202 RepID=UPI0032B20203
MDDRLVALNAVIGHCRELAELYRGDRTGVDAEAQSLFSARRDASLAETFDGIEDQLEQAVADALKHELPDGLAESLARLRTLISQHRDSLGDLSR